MSPSTSGLGRHPLKVETAVQIRSGMQSKIFLMKHNEIAERRLVAHRILHTKKSSPEEVVRNLCAMQSQDYLNAKWPIGSRAGCSEKEVINSINKGEIIRTWPMRGTLHFVSSKDVYWLLDLLSFKALQGAKRRMEFLGIDEKLITKCKKIAEKVLANKNCLTKEEFEKELVKNKVEFSGQIRYHVIWRMSQDGLICFAKEKGKHPTLALLEEWVPKKKHIVGDEALKELATRYFTSHGPATLKDYQWWCGLTMKDARLSIELAKENLELIKIDDDNYYFGSDLPKIAKKSSTNILSGFDEFILGYKDRTPSVDPKFLKQVQTVNGLFSHCIIEKGKVIATYKKSVKKDELVFKLNPFNKLKAAQIAGIKEAAKVYEKYFEKKVQIEHG